MSESLVLRRPFESAGGSGEPVVTNSRVFYTTRGCGCGGHPAFPAPSDFRGTMFVHSSGAPRREIAEAYVAVIASEAKQSSLSLCCAMDCFASLAMTNLAV
jgi:hypothetical protein